MLGTAFLRNVLIALLSRLVTLITMPMKEQSKTMKHSKINILIKVIISGVLHGGKPAIAK
jgi:hypothetical protein